MHACRIQEGLLDYIEGIFFAKATAELLGGHLNAKGKSMHMNPLRKPERGGQ